MRELHTKFGNPAPETQEVLSLEDGWLFQSYESPIAFIGKDGTVKIYPKWNASQTTAYYRSQFLGENTAKTRRRIRDGDYVKVGDWSKVEEI